MPNTTVTITYANGSTREFIASDDLEQLIDKGEMFSVTTMHSDMGINEEYAVSKMYAGNPVAAMGHMIMMKRNAEKMHDEGDENMYFVIETLTVCIKFMSDEITSHQSNMSKVEYKPHGRQFRKGEPLVPVDMTMMGDEDYNHGVKEDCPVINNHCQHYSYQTDNFGQVAIEHCTHPDNSLDTEGNCTKKSCPIKQGIVTPADGTGSDDGCS